MLIQKKVSMDVGETVAFRLSTGEEIIAEVSALDDVYVTVKAPHRLVGTQQGAALVPYSMISQDATGYHINKSHIVMFYGLNPDVEKEYVRVATGIQLA